MPGHVLVAFEFGSVNGGENSFLAVADRLRERGWKFTALAPVESPLGERLTQSDIPIVSLKQSNEAGVRLTQADRRAEFAKIVTGFRPDLVHCNSLSMSRLCGPVCRQQNIPSVGYLRDIIKISRKAMDDINQLDRIVTVSEATRSFHIERGLSAERSLTIHNGIDRDAFLSSSTSSTSSIRGELDLADDTRLLLSCGQIGMRKGLDTLVEAFIQLVSSETTGQSQPHLLIVGQRHSEKQEAIDYEEQLFERVGSAGLNNRVHFLGRRTDVAAIMQQSTLLVHAARQEPLGRVLLEAAAVGLPIVATDTGGTSEVLSLPTFKPCLIPADDSAALANAMQTLLADDGFRDRLARQLQQHAETSFTVEACAAHLNTQYLKITSNRASEHESS